MTSADNKQRMQNIFSELAKGNGGPFVDSFADDVRWTIAGKTKWSRTYHGRKDVIENIFGMIRQRIDGNVKVAAHRIVADGDLVVVEASGSATTKTGKPYDNGYCWIFRLADGKVQEITEYLDTELVTRVFGEEPGANLTQTVPFFMVADMAASLRFYVDGLGFTMTNSWRPRSTIEWCWLQRGGGAVMLQEYRPGRRPDAAAGVGVSVCFLCEDAIAYYKELTSRGIDARRPSVGNGLWVTNATDPDGHRLYFESPTDVAEETQYEETTG
jgi:ketosteroid isomerase-like protein